MPEMLEVADALPETSDPNNWENLYTDHRYPETLADLLNILDQVKASVLEAGFTPDQVTFLLWKRGEAAAVDFTFMLDKCAEQGGASLSVDVEY